MSNAIKVFGATENNLKNLNVDIPNGILCGVCGVSGSGKSTLAIDVISQYAMKNFSLSLPTYLRNIFFSNYTPKVGKIDNLPPVILVDVKNANKSSRSTVATISGLMTILRNIFSQFANTGTVKIYPKLFSYNIAKTEGGGACSLCNGTGIADTIDCEKIIKNNSKSIFNGGLEVVSEKGIKYTKISDLFLKAFCKQFSISTTCSISELSIEEKKLLLYGSNKLISFTDRTGANGGKKNLAFPGIVNALLDVYNRTKNTNIAEFIIKENCPTCNGNRYHSNVTKYKLEGKTIVDILNMPIQDAFDFINSLSETKFDGIHALKREFCDIAKELVDIGVGYLELSRSITTISGGELQRIKIAKLIAMKLSGYCYVIDEPSTGLHHYNISALLQALDRIKGNGNTVIVVEHNMQILKECDYLIELGEEGGASGGNIVFKGTPLECSKGNTLTGKSMKRWANHNFIARDIQKTVHDFISINNVTVNNLKNVNLMIPLNKFVSVAGVSGSGKSSAINTALYEALSDYFKGHTQNPNLSIAGNIKHIVSLQQSSSVANSRSIIATLLNVMDAIRDIFANLSESRKRGYDKAFFSLNSKKGCCELCNGIGYLNSEEGGIEETCPSCEGYGYSESILRIKYKGFNIAQLLEKTITEVKTIFDAPEIIKVLNACDEIGIGYLSLGQNSTTLSKGEYQRIRIVNEICKINNEPTLFILDEPSKGLHISDTIKLVNAFNSLVNLGHSVIAIEHNLDVITSSEYIIEFGPGAGEKGGNIIFEGTPNEIINESTPTAQAIRGMSEYIHSKEHSQYKEIDDIVLRQNIICRKKLPDLCIKKHAINILRGNIASGKSEICKHLLYANPFKKYMISVSPQGKYLTRDITAYDSGEVNLPLSRLIDGGSKFYRVNERVAETLNLNGLISDMFYKYGKVKNNNIKEIYQKATFNCSKITGKCKVCNGDGRKKTYDFNAILKNEQMKEKLYSLLYSRTRFNRIAPLLKTSFGIGIDKNYLEMNEEERRIFLYGDKNKEVLYKPKNKVYTWSGCNNELESNISYATEELAEFAKSTYRLRQCDYCNGTGLPENILKAAYKGISMDEFIKEPVEKLYKKLIETADISKEEELLCNHLESIIALHMGYISLYSYVSDMSIGEKSIVQYLTYRFNPLFNTMIIWENFSYGKSELCQKAIMNDLKKYIEEGSTVVLSDNNANLTSDGANIISLSDDKYKNSQLIQEGKFGCFIIDRFFDNSVVDRNSVILSNKTTVGSISGCMAKIKKEFKNKYKKYSFNNQKQDEKCYTCNGTGFYELNSGILGFTKNKCPECDGSGFNKEVLSCKLYDLNISHISKMPIEKLYAWLIENGYNDIAKTLKMFLNLHLGTLSPDSAISNVSYNEASIMLICKFLMNKEPILRISNLFVNVPLYQQYELLNVIDNMCKERKKRIEIIKEMEIC